MDSQVLVRIKFIKTISMYRCLSASQLRKVNDFKSSTEKIKSLTTFISITYPINLWHPCFQCWWFS